MENPLQGWTLSPKNGLVLTKGTISDPVLPIPKGLGLPVWVYQNFAVEEDKAFQVTRSTPGLARTFLPEGSRQSQECTEIL
jgi:hypothetical protein